MSLDQILMIPGYSGSGGGGGPASSFPDPASYYDPTLTSSTYHAEYSIVRPLRAGITEVMLCRRASDNAELAFGGLYDPAERASLESWSGGGDVFVKTIYDQSGNNAHLTQATTTLQGKIVDSGSIIYHDEKYYGQPGIPAIDMSAASDAVRYAGTAGAAISNCNVSVLSVFRHAESQAGAGSSRINGLIIGAENKFFTRYDPDQTIAYVNNTPYLTFAAEGRDSTTSLSPLSYLPSVGLTTFDATDSAVYRNNTITSRHTHSETPDATLTALQLGSSTPGLYYNGGKLSELIITTALDDTDRNALYATVNGFYSLGPTTAHTVPGYQVEPWQETINDWLASLTSPDVAVTPGAMTWDGTYSTNDQLSNLWLKSDLIDDDWSLTSESKYWLADDGGGAGFIPSHVNHYYVWRKTSDANGVSCARLAAFYGLDLPLSGGGQGNPFYQSSGLGMRALAQAGATLVGHLREQMTSPSYTGMADIGGGSVAGAMFAFHELKPLLSESVREAFYKAGVFYAWKFEKAGARHDNANMDAKCLPFLAIVWMEADAKGDTEGKDACERAARQILFGSPTGTPATSVWDIGDNPKAGIYATAGHFPENGTPETTYNGQATKEVALALRLAGSAAEWGSLGECLDAYNDFQELQSFDDYTTINADAFQGPSGYSSRTSGTAWRDQGGEEWKYAVMAERDSTARWLARHKSGLPSTASMVSTVQTKVNNVVNEAAVTVPDESGVAACHTNGYDWTQGNTFTVDTATNEIVIIGTHNLQVNDPIVPHQVFGTAPTSSAGPFAATQFWYVVGVSGQRIQVSNTLAGAAVTFSDGGFATSYSPHRLVPIYHLTDLPDLTYPVSGTSVLHWLEAGSESGIILEVDEANDLVAALTPGTAIASGSAVDYKIVSGPREIGSGMHWPPLPIVTPPSGWYDTLKALVDANDASTFTRTETTGQTYNLSLDDEWWAYKNTDGSLEHAWFVSANTYGGANNGHHAMNLEGFWAQDYGVAILTRRFDPKEGENVYSNAENWITGHVWGKDDKGTPTGFSDQRGQQPDATNSFNLAGSPPTVTTTRIIGAGGAGGTDGMENGDEISGTMTVDRTFAVNPAGDGIRVTVSVSSDQSDSVTELWHTIPVYLRDALQSGLSDASIQYWNGSTWASLDTSLVSADWIRLTRNHGSGDKYVFIHFSATQEVKLNPAVREQSYQEQARSRMIHINLHSATPGSAALLPSVGAPASVTYDIQTTDPGLVPSAPSVAVSYPATNDELFAVEGIWFGRATITGTGSITATLQYSTDSTDGSDGTWSTAGTMVNTTGDVFEFVGSDFSGDAAIPTGLTYVRVQATDSAGTTNSPVAVTSTAVSLILEDGFGAADDTPIDGSYTGWTTNTTGNTYTQTLGILECRSNKCIRDKTADGGVTFGASVRLEIGTTDCVSEVDVVPNGTDWHLPGPGCQHCSSTANNNNLRWVIRKLNDISIIRQSAIEASLILGTPVTSTDTIRLRFQTQGAIGIGMAYNVTTATYLGYAVHTANSRTGTGFGFGEEDEQATLDNVKCWKA